MNTKQAAVKGISKFSQNFVVFALTGAMPGCRRAGLPDGRIECGVATLRTDAVITLSNKPWDVAAGVIIAREAGAVLVDKDGSEQATASLATIGSTPELVDSILKLVAESEAELDGARFAHAWHGAA